MPLSRRFTLVVLAAALAFAVLVVPIRAEPADGAVGLSAGATSVRAGGVTAIVSATIDPEGATDYYFEYGTTASFGSATKKLRIEGFAPHTVTAELTGLTPGAEYRVRVVAKALFWPKATGVATAFVTAADPTAVPAGEPVTVPTAPSPDTGAPTTPSATTPDPGVTPAEPRLDSPVPAQGTAVVATARGGEIRIKPPGASFRALPGAASVPVGSVVDARNGSITLSSETADGTQIGQFGGGIFEVRQDPSGGGMTTLRLRGGSFAACRRRATATVHAAGKRKRVVRALWGKDKGGRFRTHGRDSVATVRGTAWKVVDRCDGTVTRVTEGAVVVRDRHTGRRTLVRAGERHFARHR